MRTRITFFLELLLVITTVNAQNKHITPPTKQKESEAKALAQINSLYEVKDFIKNTKTSMPVVVIDDDPDSIWNYYRVNVGISNFNMMRTAYHFFVAPKTFKVYIWDEMDNSGIVPIHLISLEQWRRWRHNSSFNSFHTIRNNKLIILDKDGRVISKP